MYWSKLLAERAELDWRKATEKAEGMRGERENAKMASGARANEGTSGPDLRQQQQHDIIWCEAP